MFFIMIFVMNFANINLLCFALGPYGSHTIHSGTQGVISYESTRGKGVEVRLRPEPHSLICLTLVYGLNTEHHEQQLSVLQWQRARQGTRNTQDEPALDRNNADYLSCGWIKAECLDLANCRQSCSNVTNYHRKDRRNCVVF